jgi:long-chain fatty acid transport protein
VGQRWSAIALVLCAVVSGQTFADGVVRDGLGAVSSGRGGTNLAYGDNGSVLMDNAAGMLRAPCCGLFDAGMDVLFTDLGYSDPGNSTGASDNPFPMGQVAYWRKSEDDQWAFGLGVFAPAGFSSVYDLQGPAPFLGPRHYKSIGALARILPGVAYQVTDRLSIGGTCGVAVSHIELEGPYFLQSAGPLRGTPTMLDLQQSGAAFSWSFGMQYQLTDTTLIGLNYQDENRFRMDGNARVEVLGLGETYFDTRMQIVWPRTLGLGARHELSPTSIFGIDLIWFDWSHAFDAIDIRFQNPTSPVFGAVVGNLYDERFPLDWRDTLSLRAGHEFLLENDRVFRLGYVYHSNPIPDATLTPFIQTTLEHGVSTGYGWLWNAYQVNLAYQYNFGRTRHVGTSDLAGGDFSSSRVQTDAHWLYCSFVRQF